MGATYETPFVNKSLITLKIVVFLVITGITALHILHSTKPYLLGIDFEQYRTISIIAPFVSIIGPLIVGPLADRFAAKNPSNFGKILRFLLAICLILSAIIYACLFAVPKVERKVSSSPHVSFACDSSGAIILQERCNANASCYNWDHKIGSLNLTNCTYTCHNPTKYENLYLPWLENIPTPSPSTEHSSEFSDYGDDGAGAAGSSATTESLRSKRSAAFNSMNYALERENSFENAGGELLSAEEHNSLVARLKRAAKTTPNKVYVAPPHLCMTSSGSSSGDSGNGEENKQDPIKNCHVYTEDTKNILVHSTLHGATNTINDTYSANWCSYPFDNFKCNIPQQQVDYMIELKNNIDCKPMIECVVNRPYDSWDSVLAGTECWTIVGDVDTTLTSYTIVRLLGDIFPMAALALLNTAIVIAVRETNEQRGEVCRQYVWGAIGYVLLFSPLDIFFFDKEMEETASLVALIILIVTFLLAALILLIASQMPLSPPEWWWHTKTGALVYPMSAIRRYSPEIVVLTIVAILFGTFWSSIHSFLRWTFTDSYAVTFSGLLLVFVLFFNVDQFIEYCGHSNIFIAGFALFIVRFTALSYDDLKWVTIVMEAIEPTIIGIVWITIILYMRHAMPRKLTATGQAIGVIAFFGLGKGFGALIGLARNDIAPEVNSVEINQWLASAASIIALVYFILYNLILGICAPNWTAKPQHNDDLMSGSASQNFTNGAGSAGGNTSAGATLNGNGNYSPLRVYHNERGKKGQFRF